MNIEELKKTLRQVISEEVRNAMRLELREILTEAVEIASRPDASNRKLYSNSEKTCKVCTESSTGYSIGEMLQETAKSMTQEEYQNILGIENNVEQQTTNTTNICESSNSDNFDLPPFAKRAKSILDAANRKDIERHAI